MRSFSPGRYGWNQVPGQALAIGVTGHRSLPDEQAIALRDAMRVLFPEAVALVSAARQGFMREN